MESIRSVFGSPSRSVPPSIGSVKGNIGHCESAAGVAGILKVLDMMKYGEIPPQANHNKLNQKIPDIGPDRMGVNLKLKPWDVPLRAALVNSYGAAGSNCALSCCEFPAGQEGVSEAIRRKDHKISFPIILSASTRNALVSTAKAIATHLSENSTKIDMADVAFTLDQRRKRQIFCFDALATDTGVFDTVQTSSFEYTKQAKPVVLVFSGQFDSKVGLSRGLYDIYPIFRSYVDACGEEVVRLGYQSIRTALG
jgi:acyl transferase domain-containing protein